jgi:hypothetical protein
MATPSQNPEQPGRGRSEAAPTERDALASLGAELLRRATDSQPALEAAWDELMAQWGIRGEPVGIQQLRTMIQQECGTSPDDNAFTRELIALRAGRS